jgi:2-haloalkanoic acid dehalogenase type II
MPRNIRCVTFDCYGTLIDWESGLSRALLALPVLEGHADLVKRIVGKREELEKALLVSAPDLPDEDTADERYESLPYRPYREILAESIVLAARAFSLELAPAEAESVAMTMSEWEPFEDTRPALIEIAKRFPIGILSNVEDEVMEVSLERIGVPFDVVVTAERVEAYKPSPDHWYAAMHELEADEEDLLHLGASPFHDLETASLLGIPCAYVNRSGHAITPLSHPLFVVRDMASAAERLKSFAPAVKTAAGARSAKRPAGAGGPRPHRGARPAPRRSRPRR